MDKDSSSSLHFRVFILVGSIFLFKTDSRKERKKERKKDRKKERKKERKDKQAFVDAKNFNDGIRRRQTPSVRMNTMLKSPEY